MKKKLKKNPHKYDTLGAIQKSNEKIVERGIQRTKRNKNRYGITQFTNTEKKPTKINVNREYQRGNQNGQSTEIGDIGHTRRRKAQHKMLWTPLHENKHK